MSQGQQRYTPVLIFHMLHIYSSGQQILRGDRVIIKGEKPGKNVHILELSKIIYCMIL